MSLITKIYGQSVCFVYTKEKLLFQLFYASNIDWGRIMDIVRFCDIIKKCAAIIREKAQNFGFKFK